MRHVIDVPLVEVTWLDAYLDLSDEVLVGQEAEEVFGKVIERRDVGYLHSMDKKKLVLAVGIGKTDNSFNHSNSIPRAMITRIEYLDRSGRCLELTTKRTRKTTVPTGSSRTSESA